LQNEKCNHLATSDGSIDNNTLRRHGKVKPQPTAFKHTGHDCDKILLQVSWYGHIVRLRYKEQILTQRVALRPIPTRQKFYDADCSVHAASLLMAEVVYVRPVIN